MGDGPRTEDEIMVTQRQGGRACVSIPLSLPLSLALSIVHCLSLLCQPAQLAHWSGPSPYLCPGRYNKIKLWVDNMGKV